MTTALPVILPAALGTHQAFLTPVHVGLLSSGDAGTVVADLFELYVRFHRSRYGWE